jgi:hypothetical protein
LLLEYELVSQEMARLAVVDRPQEEHP